MGAPVQKRPLDGAQVLRPLPLEMDERPLAAAEGEVLQAGQGEVVLLAGDGYTISVQDTPSGSAPVSTDTM